MIEDFIGAVIVIAITVTMIALFVIGAVELDKYEDKIDDDLWNNGYCSECDGQWIYEQAVGHRYSTSYIYVCDKCGKRIEIGEIR